MIKKTPADFGHAWANEETSCPNTQVWQDPVKCSDPVTHVQRPKSACIFYLIEVLWLQLFVSTIEDLQA